MKVEHAVWTFVIRGGIPFRIGVRFNPVLDHDGRMTVWKLVGSKAVADEMEQALSEFGCQVTRHTEEQTPELIAARGQLPD